MSNADLIAILTYCFVQSESEDTGLPEEVLAIESQTGPGTRSLLNRLAKALQPVRYLEVGLRDAASFCAALYHSDFLNAVSVDLPLGINHPDHMLNGINQCLKWVHSNVEGSNWRVHFTDCWNLPGVALIEDANLFLFDGPHAKEDHQRALRHYYDALADRFIMVVDDWNWEDTRMGTFLGIKESGCTILHEEHRSGSKWFGRYYNGVWGAAIQKPSCL